jgi:hypothetical protein
MRAVITAVAMVVFLAACGVEAPSRHPLANGPLGVELENLSADEAQAAETAIQELNEKLGVDVFVAVRGDATAYVAIRSDGVNCECPDGLAGHSWWKLHVDGGPSAGPGDAQVCVRFGTSTEHRKRLVQHELLHTLDIAHSSEESLMDQYASEPTLLPATVNYVLGLAGL